MGPLWGVLKPSLQRKRLLLPVHLLGPGEELCATWSCLFRVDGTMSPARSSRKRSNKYQSQKKRSSVLSCQILPSHTFRPDTWLSSGQATFFFSFQIKIRITTHPKLLPCPQVHPPSCHSRKPGGYLCHLHGLLINHHKPLSSKSKVSHEYVCSLPSTPHPRARHRYH